MARPVNTWHDTPLTDTPLSASNLHARFEQAYDYSEELDSRIRVVENWTQEQRRLPGDGDEEKLKNYWDEFNALIAESADVIRSQGERFGMTAPPEENPEGIARIQPFEDLVEGSKHYSHPILEEFRQHLHDFRFLVEDARLVVARTHWSWPEAA